MRASAHPDAPVSWTSILTCTIGSCLVIALTALGLRFIEFYLQVNETSAATGTYQAMLVSLAVPSSLAPGQVGEVVVQFQNTGTTTWVKTGTNFFSLYRYNALKKIETTSVFSTSAWNTPKRPTLLPKTSVAPGQTVSFRFPIKAPLTIGSYHEDFILCAENLAWLKTGKFSLDIQVKGNPSVSNAPTPVQIPVSPQVSAPTSSSSVPSQTQTATTTVPTLTSSPDWMAEVTDKGGLEWQIEPGEHVRVTLGFKNTGKKTWTRDDKNFVSLYSVDTQNKERVSPFNDTNWISRTQSVKLKEAAVKPGEIGHIVLDLRAPDAPGSYTESFSLAAENAAWISGGQVTLPIKVPMTPDFIATAPPGSDMITSVPDQPKQDGRYSAMLLIRSAPSLTLLGNGSQEITF
ncbi:MAG TPA: NBR1-Ig-like domain-containing protein, partial [Patescibacteria group bacterium]|nr:NBR1-Ig-like domain-containing protein [Patescibacteria group bacterium]